ncbi:MAG: FtsQ-type POTRA domain-containing protein [Prochloraceae cyanobacterium]|nr:FtsQ-type POTRA domain-containing protein [Prochloraceae cyanobacterium]
MTSKTLISANEIEQKRQQLQRQRKIEFCQGLWRLLILTSLSGGLCWAIANPLWIIRGQSQIKIKGNQFVATRAIREAISVFESESLLQLSPQELIQHLKSTAPVEQATISRQLFPTTITIEVKETLPVAIALSPKKTLDRSGSYTREVGFLDERGTWISKNSYHTDKKGFKLPTLKISGSPKHYLPYWQKLYQLIDRSSVQIDELNWQDPNNIILETELGKVHLGADISKFSQQLSVLSQMRKLPDRIQLNQIAYIDLTNPQSPKIQLQKKLSR